MAVLALAAMLALALGPAATASQAGGCGLLGLSVCPAPPPPAASSPDPGGDENAAVTVPPGDGRLVGFSGIAADESADLDPAGEYDVARAAGANAMRLGVAWSSVEPVAPVAGRHHYFGDGPELGYLDTIDEKVAALDARGLRPILVLDSAPVWAQGGSLLHRVCSERCDKYVEPDPRFLPDWQAQARFLAARYPSAVFEIWNEPNLAAAYRPKPNAGRYLSLFDAAYRGIKSARPDAVVLTGGLGGLPGTGTAGIETGAFLDELYGRNLRSVAPDFKLGLHAYPGEAGLGRGSRWAAFWQRVTQTMAKYGDSGRPVWVTETGISTTPLSMSGREDGPYGLVATPVQQADILRRVYRRLMTIDRVGTEAPHVNVKAVLFYTMLEQVQQGPESVNYGFGLMGHFDLKPKPAFCWMAGDAPAPAPRARYPGC